MKGAVFLDRDGVIIEDRADYVKSWQEVQFIPAAFGAIRKLTEVGIPTIIITNQSAVGRGIITQDFVEKLHTRMLEQIEAAGGRIDAVYFCPHNPTEQSCMCRKPLPGMLFQAAQECGLDLASSVMIGDSIRDLESASAAGSKAILVRTGNGIQEEIKLPGSKANDCTLAVVQDIAEAVELVLSRNYKDV